MSSTENPNDSESEIVSVTKHGQATIPKRFREKLGIDAPGTVLFRETDEGDVVVERVPSPSEMRGSAARNDPKVDTPATRILREKRDRDREERASEFEER